MIINTEMERWVPVIIKHHGKEFEKSVYDTYEVSCRCRIRNKKTMRTLSDKTDYVKLRGNNVSKSLVTYRVCLASFYPNKIPKDINNYDVDHIDGNHKNNVLSNLQWLTKNEHSKKTMKQTHGKRKSTKYKRGKMVMIVSVKDEPIIGPSMVGRTFYSQYCAEKKLNLTKDTISNCIKKGYWLGIYKFEYITQQLLPGEIFKKWNDYHVSNRGRYKNKNGKITNGKKHGKYRKANLTVDGVYKGYYIHIIMWEAFNGPIPEGLVVMHNDTYKTLDDEGCERNWLEDCSLGTLSENTQSYHDNRRNIKRVRCLDDGREFICAASAGRHYGINGDLISLVCRKKRKTTFKKKFEYI
jgi:hypothetical protein